MKKTSWLFLLLFLTAETYPQPQLGKHTVTEWRHIIDTTWGIGSTTIEKLQIFDAFWNTIDQSYAGFQGIQDNWEQMRSYRDTVALGVSRGKFAGILDNLVQSLHDGHVYMMDRGVAATPLNAGVPLLYSVGNELPLYNWGAASHFGAALTPLPDSTLLVYAAVTNHPIGLVPGDVILGYDGRPWKDLFKELIEVQFPMPFFFVMSGSDRAATHQWLQTAGMNWHLFDTIDIAKYGTGDTIHLPTNLLSNPMPGIRATEQMPIAGVPFPDVAAGRRVSWGYISGTKTGYIYVWGWSTASVDQDFLAAVNALMPDTSSHGLIIDIRLNEGGGIRWELGFRRLFNQNVEAARWSERASTSNHLAMQDAGPAFLTGADAQLYDRPIAVLCGPSAISGGDMSVNILRWHPMTRTFGLPTNGAFGTYVGISGIPSEWLTGFTWAVLYSPPDMNNVLNRRSISVDEEVWLTRDGVANGEDAVVNRALAWMDSLSYAHNVRVSRDTVRNPADSIRITAKVENPRQHALVVSAIVTNAQGSVVDSVVLTNAPGDSVWGKFIRVPGVNGRYNVSVRTTDVTAGTYRRLPTVAWFAIVTDVDELAENLPQEFGLQQNYPNPFNPTTRIKYQLPIQSHVTLKVYNLMGQEVSTLVDRVEEPGYKSVQWDANGVASGMYFCRLQAGSFVNVKKLILLK